MLYIGLHSEKQEKIIVSEAIRPIVLIIGLYGINGPLPSLFKLWPWGQKWPGPMCHQGHGQLSTDTTQVSDLEPHGPLVL